MSTLLNSPFISVFGALSLISLVRVFCFAQEPVVTLVLLCLFTEEDLRFWFQKAAEVQSFSCGLIPEDVPLCSSSHKFQPLDPFLIWTFS